MRTDSPTLPSHENMYRIFLFTIIHLPLTDPFSLVICKDPSKLKKHLQYTMGVVSRFD